VDPADLELRNVTYRRFVELGRAPTVSEVGAAARLPVEAVVAGWRRLHDEHALVLDTATDEILMANPFEARPTPFRVETGGRRWYANCAWDAFGIGAALELDSRIETTCPDCQQPIELVVSGGRPDDLTPVFHVLVPAVAWWQDIGFT
jgi:hypothetical protein